MNENVEQWQVRKPAVSSPEGAVAAQHWQAARAGAAMLAQGGNAVDAAVACAMA
ncbi:MAG TPA: gamma-glutamyltransferase, partial [Kiloniellaceae bacterium]|nr:gamma-glutamyltransferase [Kiloniellaceae bacterium]